MKTATLTAMDGDGFLEYEKLYKYSDLSDVQLEAATESRKWPVVYLIHDGICEKWQEGNFINYGWD